MAAPAGLLQAAIKNLQAMIKPAKLSDYFDVAKAKLEVKDSSIAAMYNLVLPIKKGSKGRALDESNKVWDAVSSDRSSAVDQRFKFEGKEWLVGDGDDTGAYTVKNGKAYIWLRSWDEEGEEPAAPAKKTSAAKSAKGNDLDPADTKKMIAILNKKTGSKVTEADYDAWLNGDGDGNFDKFQNAVDKLIGKVAFDLAEDLARADNLLWYAVGLGPDMVGGISMSGIMKAAKGQGNAGKAKPRLAAQSAAKDSGIKRLAKAKAQLKDVNAGIAKLKNVKAVQNYIKLAKMQARLKGKLG